MKLYCFQFESPGDDDYPTENGVAIAKSKDEAYKIFAKKYLSNRTYGYCTSFEEVKEKYKVVKVYSLDKPVVWFGRCTN